MARICWVVPRLKRDKFTGGVYCILRHADGLARRGHEVSVVPLLNSEEPTWFEDRRFDLSITSKLQVAWKTFQSARPKRSFESALHAAVSGLAAVDPRILPFSLRHAAMCERARALLPEADITIATSFETALPVSLYGKGALAYYAQHFEPYFLNEFDDPGFAGALARASYSLPLRIIANSPWLQNTIVSEAGAEVCAVAGNAIDESMYGNTRTLNAEKPLRVISYGGRGAVWKGFREMAEGVRRARAQGIRIEWSVYGDCALPPDNSVAAFNHLGFLNQRQLASAYRDSDILLSASWYESFPLFPLEAMAAGLAVITTQPGTEIFAEHMKTAWVVPPRDPESLAHAIVELAENSDLRLRLGVAGMKEASKHTWDAAVTRMERILLDALEKPVCRA